MKKAYKVGEYELTASQFNGEEVVDGDLTLNVKVLPKGFKPNFSGSVDLRSLTSLNNDITAGGYVYLNSNCKLNGIIYKNQKTITALNILKWKNEKYISVDSIFAEVVNKKTNVYKLKKIGSKDVFYCVTDSNGRWAHGDTLKKAKEDLIYKISASANKEKYSKLKLDSVLSFADCIEFYRVMTGACAFGVKNFIESNNIEQKDYSVAQIIEKTKGKYGNNSLSMFKN